MKKLLLGLLLIITSTSAVADWVDIGVSTGTDIFTQYVDLASMRKTGTALRVWALRDFDTVVVDKDGDRYLSSKTLYEIDCKDWRSRLLSLIQYSDNMGKGNIVWSTSGTFIGNWDFVVPESIGELIQKAACGKK